jgi:hypothetical protein
VPYIREAPNGSALVIWVDSPYEPNSPGSHAYIEASRRPRPGAGWSEPRIISGGTQNNGGPRLAMLSDGSAVASWESTSAHGTTVYAAVMSAGGRWTRPHRLGTGDFAVLASNGNDALLVWNTYLKEEDGFDLRAAWWRGGRWRARQTLVRNLPGATNMFAALNGRGRGVIAAAAAPPGFKGDEGLFAWPLSSYRLGQRHTLTAKPVGYGPAQFCTAPGQAITAVWFDGSIGSASYSTGGRWSSATRLAPGGGFPSCATDALGDTAAAWVEPAGTPGAFLAYRPAAGSWSAPTNVALADDRPARIGVTLRSDGSGSAYWSAGSQRGGPSVLRGAVYNSDSGWQASGTIAAGGIGYVDLATTGARPTLFAWDARGRIFTAAQRQ